MGATAEITVRERIQFAAGDFFVGGGASLLSVLYLIFLTDVVKLAPGLAGTAVLVAKLWDAINDPLTGSISDRVRTRWGRRRPFIVVGALLLLPVMALFWLPDPPPASQVGLAVWAALTYIAYNTVQTVISVPYASLSTEISVNFDQRNKVNVLRLLFSTVASAGTTLLAARLFEDYRNGRLELTELYLTIVLGFGGVFVLIMLGVGLFTRERVPMPARIEPFTLAGFLAPLKLGAYRRLLGMYLCQALAFDVITTTVMYYTLYVVVGVSAQVLLGIFIAVTVLAFPLVNWLVGRVDKHRIYRTLLPIAIGTVFVVALFPRGANPVLLYGTTFVMAIGFVGAQLMSWVMFPDVLDAAELASGQRNAGAFSGLMTFIRGMATALTIQLIALVLQLTGYRAPVGTEVVTQTDTVQWGIRLTLLLAVAVLLSLGWLISRGYPLTLARCRAMQDELAVRRGTVDSSVG